MARVIKKPEPVVINPEKIVRGLTTVFQGFSIMFDGLSEQLSLMQEVTEQIATSDQMVDKSAEKSEKKGKKAAIEEEAKAEIQTKEMQSETVAEDATAEVKENAASESQGATDTSGEELPWDIKPFEDAADTAKDVNEADPDAKSVKEAKNSVSITADNIREVVVAKIKQNRKNNEQIGKLLSAYGVKLLSDLPAEKYELFLNDISQL